MSPKQTLPLQLHNETRIQRKKTVKTHTLTDTLERDAIKKHN